MDCSPQAHGPIDQTAKFASPSMDAKAISAKDDREAAALITLAERAWRQQVALDLVDEASMESFPCSDPPSYYTCHV